MLDIAPIMDGQKCHNVDLCGFFHFYSVNFQTYQTRFLHLFSNKMLVIRAGTYKMLARIANREDPDQTASSEAV